MKEKNKPTYAQLERLDRVYGLVDRSLHVFTGEHPSWEWIDVPSSCALGLAPEQHLELYGFMLLTRATDEKLRTLSLQGLAFGKHLMSSGNEAVSVGAAYALRKSDWFTIAIRDLGALLTRGLTPGQVIAQACGRVDGPTKGWDGSLHLGSREHCIVPLISHLPMVPVATGCAFFETYTGGDGVALAFCGDGATSTGDFAATLNIASVKRLPLVVVIENNQWAFGTPNALQFAPPTKILTALGYGKGVEGYLIDGMNVLTVLGTVQKAVERARHERVITVIEALSMRLEGHSLADPFRTYVPETELTRWKARDPLKIYREFLLKEGIADERNLEILEDGVKRRIVQAVAFAEQSPLPDAMNIESAVFSPTPAHPVVLSEPPKPNPGEEARYLTYHDAISEALAEETKRNPDLFHIGEDIGVSDGPFKITKGFSKLFDGYDWQMLSKNPETRHLLAMLQRRVIDSPLSEAGMCAFAAGAAIRGLWAVVELQYADFATEAVKWIGNHLATQSVHGMSPLHIVFRLPAGWTNHSGPYHSLNPEPLFANFPGLKIVSPITAFDAKGLFNAAIRDGNPVLFLEYKGYYNVPLEKLPNELNLPVPKKEHDYVVPIGKARVVREGTALTVVTFGSQIFRVLEAISELEKERPGVSIEVIDLRSLVPFDKECILASVKKTARVLVTCEAPLTGCFGNTIATYLQDAAFGYLGAPVKLLAAADTPVPFSPPLEEAHLPTAAKVKSSMSDLLDFEF
ncbi:MAG: thiamine pyrophosphate-dependent enzyme [bacterium]|nr:thiamine pyrophosphate-dependent enzyme [bacterium]